MDLTFKFKTGKRLYFICPDYYSRRVVRSLPLHWLDQYYNDIRIVIKPPIKFVWFDITIYFHEATREFLSVANKIYIPYLDLTREKLMDTISAINWEWGLFDVPPIFWGVEILIITDNPKFIHLLCETISDENYGYKVKDFGIQLCNKSIQIHSKATVNQFWGAQAEHIIYLVDMEDLKGDAIHHHTTIDSKKELKMLLSRIKWRWE